MEIYCDKRDKGYVEHEMKKKKIFLNFYSKL